MLFSISKHAPLINYSSWNCATSSEIPNHSHVVTCGTAAPLYQRSFVGGTWWISEQCSFHLLTAEIAWGCWRVPDKQGLLHASPWSTFSVAPWIHLGLWQHAPFWAFYIIVDDVVAAGSCCRWWRRWLWCSAGLRNEYRTFYWSSMYTVFLINK